MAGEKKENHKEKEACFVIMPISDPEEYTEGHFKRVYEDIFKVAIEGAGFIPIRADDVHRTNLIHVDILRKLIESPMAICDLSSRNPNVLFELGVRQAFDKPTVLVQEEGTPKIFDINVLRMVEYKKTLGYRDVLEAQRSIQAFILETKKATAENEGLGSLINLLSLTAPARLNESTIDNQDILKFIMSEISSLKADFQHSLNRREDRMIYSRRTSSVERLTRDFLELRDAIEKGGDRSEIQRSAAMIRESIRRHLDFSTSPTTKRELDYMLHYLSKVLHQDYEDTLK